MSTLHTWIEIPIEVSYSSQPAEKADRRYPGCPESVEDIQLSFEGKPLPEILENWLANYNHYAGKNKTGYLPKRTPMDEIVEACIEDMRGEK